MDMKNSSGRLREACVARVHELRGAFTPEGAKQNPRRTYQQIATELDLSLGTVYAICVGKTHRDLVPLGHPLHRAAP